MPAIVLATLNAKYAHSAFGLRYLLANMGSLRDETTMLEFTIELRPVDVVEAILAHEPRIVGLSVYIWNVELCRQVAELLRRLAPALTIVVGGPEVSHEIDDQPWLAEVDYIVCGEGERAFPELCERLLSGRRPLQRIVDGGLPDLEAITLPYELYSDDDLRQRVLYVEASRGCPYRCEFCLSSLDKRVRAFPLPKLIAAFERLIDRGARRFKFVDRTFNLDLARSAAILEFFLDQIGRGADLFVHFEMVPDRLPAGLRDLIARFPAGSLQFEIGIQTLDDAVGERIKRRQDLGKTFDNLRFLRTETGVHMHTDLIVGLPGESAEGFGAGLDRLIAAGVQEIQIGLLKRLRGTPIARHSEDFGMVYDPRPPYSLLRSDAVDFSTMQRLRRLSLLWDTFWNRGEFTQSMRLLWADGSPFERTLAFADWLFAEAGRVHSIALHKRADYLARHLIQVRRLPKEQVAATIAADFTANGRPAPELFAAPKRPRSAKATPPRQQRHLT